MDSTGESPPSSPPRPIRRVYRRISRSRVSSVDERIRIAIRVQHQLRAQLQYLRVMERYLRNLNADGHRTAQERPETTGQSFQ
jgi:hypothetical protein